MAELYFLSGKRTAFGKFGGSLKDVSPKELGTISAQAALKQAQVQPEEIHHVIYGNVLNVESDGICTPRHIGLKAGVPKQVPALGVNRLCGSGFQVIVEAYYLFLAGDAKLALIGGVENM